MPSLRVGTPTQLDEALEIELSTHTDRPIRFRWPSTFQLYIVLHDLVSVVHTVVDIVTVGQHETGETA